MPANRANYEQAMNAGHSAAWDQEWIRAAQAYSSAIKEFPEDPEAHIHLGLALLNASRLDDALKVYKRAHQLSPDDPIPLEKSADVLERMGRLKEAAQQYINVSDVYLAQRDLDKAIGNWERATQLTPGLISIHAKLAQAYERIGDTRKAIREYLTLAFNFKRMNDVDKAIKAVERALKLDKKNPQALNTLRALRAGADVSLIVDEDVPKPPPTAAPVTTQAKREETDDPLGPMGEAMHEALTLLAGYVIEINDLDALGAVMQAMQFHRQGMVAEAAEAYQRAEPKMRHPALKMSLGGMLVQLDKGEEAAKHLGEAIMMPEIATGAFHGLGWALQKAGKSKLAVKNLVRAMQQVDVGSTLGDETEDLNGFYNQLNKVLSEANEEKLRQIIDERLLSWLTGQGWHIRLSEARRHMQEIVSREGWPGVLDWMGASGADQLTDSVSKIDRYIRQGLLMLAMDEAHFAVETSPTYLPVHVRMAEVMMREGRLRQAINKYNTVARLYMARGENDRAASILGEVLEMAPLDVPVRMSLIELLEQENRMNDALDQYVSLAGTYQQLGNFDQSREAFLSAEKLARRISAPVEKMVEIKHYIADIEQMRLDTRRSQKIYEEITQLNPGDERAQRSLVDLYYSQNNQVEAIKRLDSLLKIYARNKLGNKIRSTLEEMVKRYPNDTGLRSRLADYYLYSKLKKEAIAQLDALGELQLEAGLHAEAAATIRKIITIGPEHLDDYKRLLQQLGG